MQTDQGVAELAPGALEELEQANRLHTRGWIVQCILGQTKAETGG